jgi:uncharacterized protein (TIGR00661 family)
MKFQKINRNSGSKRVLIAPLDWGLGHATRCIPIIYELLSLDMEVIIAAGGATKKLLEKEFPRLEFVYLRGYDVKYSNKRWLLPLSLLLQAPIIFTRIYQENQWLKRVIKSHQIDAVISDNRFGLYHTTTPCIYITHQLTIKTGNRFTEWLAKKMHYFFINKFIACWVPDNEFTPTLAGELSHPKTLPSVPVIYMGPLSRFEKKIAVSQYDCLALISGPEPQRSIFENIILKHLKHFTGKTLLIRGLPENDTTLPEVNSNTTIKNHLTAAELNAAIEQSECIICRSGYTSVMDLVLLQKKALLVATPAQTEQEYLATYLQQQHIFPAMQQEYFNLNKAVEECSNFIFKQPVINSGQYKKIIQDWVSTLST